MAGRSCTHSTEREFRIRILILVLLTNESKPSLGMDYVKNVVNPIMQVAPRDSIRGFVDDYYHLTEDVLLLSGEIHYERKPVGRARCSGYT